jgi:hypothetical protein
MPDHPAVTAAQAENEVTRALELLAEALRRRVAAHPAGHLLAGRGAQLDLHLRLPLVPRNGDLARSAQATSRRLDQEVQRLVSEQALFRPGHVYCLRCESAECVHSRPSDSREVFAGYGPTGLPRFQDLGAQLLSRQDPRVSQLYEEGARFVTAAIDGEALQAELLPTHRPKDGAFRLHGQVVAGWYRGSSADGHPAQVAVTFQVLSLRLPGGPRRYGLSLVGIGPAGESLESFCNRLGQVPWSREVRWAQAALATIEQAPRGGDTQRDRRIAGLLPALAQRLEKDRRSEGRKTLHARERHEQGDRPTRMALADLAHAKPERVFADRRRDTLIVLGERGRAHVWNRQGKLVTSIRYSPEAIERRQKDESWQAARPEELESLRTHVAAAAAREE